MNNIREFKSVQKQRSEQASVWIIKLDNGLSREEEDELGVWLASSNENYQELMAVAKTWDSLDGLSRLAEIFPEPAESAAGARQNRPRRLRHPVWVSAAVFALAITCGVAWMALHQRSNPPVTVAASASEAQTVYSTIIGEQSGLTLSDGSRLVLNTNSLVKVQYTDSNRLLTLERGEIHLTVAHDPTRPLSVVVGDKIVQAVGTEFNVEITSDQSVELLVTDGVVMIGVLDAPPSALPEHEPIVVQSGMTIVAAGQQAVIKPSPLIAQNVETEAIKSEEVAVKLSWREGNLIFRGESLEEAVSEVGRYTAVEFVFLDEASKKKRLTGFFKAGDVDGLLVALQKNFNISAQWVGQDKILLGAK